MSFSEVKRFLNISFNSGRVPLNAFGTLEVKIISYLAHCGLEISKRKKKDLLRRIM